MEALSVLMRKSAEQEMRIIENYIQGCKREQHKVEKEDIPDLSFQGEDYQLKRC